MIKELKIMNLFGQFNYHIVFKDVGITIITGPNGFGKSTVLKIIESLGEKDLYDLCQFPFEKIIAKTTNQSITIEKNSDSVIVNNCALSFFPERIMENWHRRKGIPLVERVAPNTFVDLKHDKILTSQEYSALIMEYNNDNDISDRLILVNYDQSKSIKKEGAKYKELTFTNKTEGVIRYKAVATDVEGNTVESYNVVYYDKTKPGGAVIDEWIKENTFEFEIDVTDIHAGN